MARQRIAATVSANNRSRVSNGRVWLEGVTGKSKESRRWRDLCRSLHAEIGGKATESQLTLIRSTATAIIASEKIQALVIEGTASEAELVELPRLGNLVTRNLIVLGLASSPKVKRGDPDALAAYLADREGEL